MPASDTAMANFSLRGRMKSFGYAFAGIWFMLRTQHNAWIHLAATIAIVLISAALRIEANDWRWIILCISLVWTAEAFNTSVEHVCDLVSPKYDLAVKRAKDVAAGAVLFCSIAAALIGALTLWPYVFVRP